jgi:heme o synthase
MLTTWRSGRRTRPRRSRDLCLENQVTVSAGGRSGSGPDMTASVGVARPGKLAAAAALVSLTKPRIVELLLITTVPAMVLAEGGWPGTALIAATLVGGTLSAAGANSLNCYIDRHRDARMTRTRNRPIPNGDVAPGAALAFGVVLGLLGFVWLVVSVNLVAASLATGALLYYVLIYTSWLKPSTDQNIVIGGAAGAAPVLVGWSAVTGELALPAWVLFLVVFYWTPPHFWALGLRYRDDYTKASVPIMPATKGERLTTSSMVAYAVLTAVASLVLVPLAGLGAIYIVAATILGSWFVFETWRVHRDPRRAMVLFTRSTYFLALLFGFLATDVLAG